MNRCDEDVHNHTELVASPMCVTSLHLRRKDSTAADSVPKQPIAAASSSVPRGTQASTLLPPAALGLEGDYHAVELSRTCLVVGSQ